MARRQVYFPALTGMRWVAATMVCLVHYRPLPAARVGEAVWALEGELHTGVTIFFVLSGFLICHRYEEGFLGKTIRLKDYYVNRFARIYPIYFLLTVLAFIPAVGHHPFSIRNFLLNITFLHGLFTEYRRTGITVGWSLTVEEMFYAFFPVMVWLSGRIRYMVQPLIFLAAGLLLWMIFHNIPFHGFFGSLQFLFEYTFFGRCWEFYCGILLAQHFRRTVPDSRAGKKPFCTITGAVWIFACIAGLAVNTYSGGSLSRFVLYETLLNNFLLPPGIALLFYGLLTEFTLLRKCLASSFIEQLGKSSYCFYLLHVGPLLLLLVLLKKPVLLYIAIQLIAYLVYCWVERPLNKLIRRAFQSSTSANSNAGSR